MIEILKFLPKILDITISQHTCYFRNIKLLGSQQFKCFIHFYNRQIKKFPTEKQNVSLKHILT